MLQPRGELKGIDIEHREGEQGEERREDDEYARALIYLSSGVLGAVMHKA